MSGSPILIPVEEIIPEIVERAKLMRHCHIRRYGSVDEMNITAFAEELALRFYGDWCAENLAHGLRIIDWNLEFGSEADAALFKLRWT